MPPLLRVVFQFQHLVFWTSISQLAGPVPHLQEADWPPNDQQHRDLEVAEGDSHLQEQVPPEEQSEFTRPHTPISPGEGQMRQFTTGVCFLACFVCK